MTNESSKAKRATVEIGTISVEVFQLPTGEYVMSQSQAGEAIGLNHVSTVRFLSKKRSESSDSKAFQSYKVPVQKDWEGQGNRQTITGIGINLASEFWATQAFKGNKKAEALTIACVIEALERRCDSAFTELKTEQKYQEKTAFSMDAYLQSREYVREAHHSFQLACRLNDWIAPKIHDYITLGLCGKKASDLKEDELINGSPDIGLNHIADSELLTNIAKVKMQFSKYLKGTPKERVKRAIQEVMGKKFKLDNLSEQAE
jgi:hypothetical protein